MPDDGLLRCLDWPATEVAILNERFAVAVLLVVRLGSVKLCQRVPAAAVHDALVIQQP